LAKSSGGERNKKEQRKVQSSRIVFSGGAVGLGAYGKKGVYPTGNRTTPNFKAWRCVSVGECKGEGRSEGGFLQWTCGRMNPRGRERNVSRKREWEVALAGAQRERKVSGKRLAKGLYERRGDKSNNLKGGRYSGWGARDVVFQFTKGKKKGVEKTRDITDRSSCAIRGGSTTPPGNWGAQ